MNSYGFDYSYGLRIGEVNAILARNLAKTQMPLSYSGTDPQTGLAVTVTGNLGPWSVVPGGSLQLLHLSLPFTSGTIAVADNGSADLTGVTVVVQARLGWAGPGSAASPRGSGGNTSLSLALSSTNDPNDPGYVSFVKLSSPGTLNLVLQAVLTNTIVEALVANASVLQYVLASANPTPVNVSGWLAPISWDYLYIDLDNSTDGLLCFLSMLSAAPLPAINTASFDTSAVPAGTNAGVVIAASAFFPHVVAPALQNAYPAGNFTAVPNGSGYQAQSTSGFTVGKVAVSSLVAAQSPAGNGLQTQANGGGPLDFLFGLAKLPNASYRWNATTTNALTFDPASQQLGFAADGNPTVNTSHTIHWYDWVLLAVLGITNVAGLVSSIMAIVKDAGANFNGIAGQVGQAAQAALGGSTTNVANLVDWNQGGATFTAAAAGLDGALSFSGNLT